MFNTLIQWAVPVLGYLLFLSRTQVRMLKAQIRAYSQASLPPRVRSGSRQPADMRRPYPRPVSLTLSPHPLDQVCPVCSVQEDYLPGSLFGWPAHNTCVEWCGSWVPYSWQTWPPECRCDHVPEGQPCDNPRCVRRRHVREGTSTLVVATGDGAGKVEVTFTTGQAAGALAPVEFERPRFIDPWWNENIPKS